MDVKELALRVMRAMDPMVPYLLTVAAATVIVLPILLALGRGVWVQNRRFRWMSLFMGLNGGECVRLACVWVKFMLLLSYLAFFRKLALCHYLLFLVVGLIYCISTREWARIPGRIFWLLLEGVGMLTCNLICGYVHDLNGGVVFTVIYVLMALFEALFGCYLFLTELNDISAGRNSDFEQQWDTGNGENDKG